MASLQDLANQLAAILPDVKRGALRFWGDWFGRPFDNGHLLVGCQASDDCLRLRFYEGEVLAVWNPSDVQITETTFRIGSATALRWSWFYYGRPKTPENLYYLDYAQQDGGIIFRTNWDTIPGKGWLGKDASSYPAVEMPDPD
jgi:hypothetical protein